MKKYKTVEEFLADLSSEQREIILKVRELVLASAPGLTESIKWNAPNYALNGADRLTFNLKNKEQIVMLVLHMGTERKENRKGDRIMAEDEGIIEWSSDIRGVVRFPNADLEEIRHKLERVLSRWLAIPV